MKKRQIFLSLLIVLTALFSCGKRSDKGVNKKKDSGGAAIIETGTLEAINNVLFILPRFSLYWWDMRITWIAEHGTEVNEGDVIIQIDPAEVNRFILERETNLETQMANLEKMEVTQSNQIRDLESRIVNETASFNLKKMELEASLFETERHRTIKQLEFKQAEIALAKEIRKLELAKVMIENDKKIQQIKIRQIKDDLTQFNQVIPQLAIKSSVAGVFQRGRNLRTGTPYNAGDMAWPSYPMGNVPELKWMRVNTYINENDYLKIEVGQKVVVRLDALPEVRFKGEVAYIGKFCRLKEKNSRQKVFDVQIRMLDTDERLKPGMTVSCEFLPN